MAPEIGRLKRRAEFLKVAAARRKWATPGLILQAMERQYDPDSPSPFPGAAAIRVGFTVSRKVGNAVARNRARRRLRAAVAEIFPEQAAPGFDYVVIGRAATVSRPFRALVGDLAEALKRAQRKPGDAVR